MKIEDIIEAGKQLDACELLRDGMTAEELVNLVFRPQGWEFCHKHSFPTMAAIRAVAATRDAKDGAPLLIVDTDTYVCSGAHEIIVAGESNVEVVCDDGDRTTTIVLFHGAKVKIYASNYAVVKVVMVGQGCERHFMNLDNHSVLL